MKTDLPTRLEGAAAGSRVPTNAEVIAELRAVEIAVTLFGLDALPTVLRAHAEQVQG